MWNGGLVKKKKKKEKPFFTDWLLPGISPPHPHSLQVKLGRLAKKGVSSSSENGRSVFYRRCVSSFFVGIAMFLLTYAGIRLFVSLSIRDFRAGACGRCGGWHP